MDFLNQEAILEIVDNALREDLGDGDHTSLSTVPENAQGKARLLVKDDGILAGVELAQTIFHRVDPNLQIEVLIEDGTYVEKGQIAFYATGSSRSIKF